MVVRVISTPVGGPSDRSYYDKFNEHIPNNMYLNLFKSLYHRNYKRIVSELRKIQMYFLGFERFDFFFKVI